MKITTWNVNGIRAALRKGIQNWIKEYIPDILCIQETKAKREQVDLSALKDLGYKFVWNAAERPGYSGVATFYKIKPGNIRIGMGNDIFDKEGRVIQTSYQDYELFNIYFPNGGRGRERVQYKLDFYAYLLKLCDGLHKQGKKIIITGDFNTAHKEIDLKNPRENRKVSGFLPEERVWVDYYLKHGFIDIYRYLYPEKIQYTWWTYRFHARERGIGWRIDYYLISKELIDIIDDVVIFDQVQGSDHCPVSLQIEDIYKKGIRRK
ncbi:MAG TPA: exodeoxyribonuclease III [Anaerolineae bacterium]|nr:exodeoxyribonuclease III [Anaerolineae bacterium]